MSFPRYPSYRESGIDWFDTVPAHWGLERLRHLVTLNPSKSEIASLPDDREVTFLPMEAIGETGEIDATRRRPLAELKNGYTYFADGDLVFAKVTPCFENGKGALIEGLLGGCGFGTTELTVLRPHAAADAQFLRWLIFSELFRGPGSGEMLGAGGLKRVPDDFVADFRVPWPSASERQAISAFLERETARIDALVEEQRRLVDLLKEKRQAVISNAVTKGLKSTASVKNSGVESLGQVPADWVVTTLKRFFTSLDGKRIPLSAEDRGTRRGEFPYYGASGVIDYVDDFLFDEDLVLVSEDGANLINRSTPIAFVASGRYWVNNHAHILKPCDGNLAFWAERIEAIDLTPIVTGAAQPKLTADALANLPVAVPPSSDERAAIATHIDECKSVIDPLIGEAEAAIELLQERRAALISAALTGKIDVRSAAVQQAEAA